MDLLVTFIKFVNEKIMENKNALKHYQNYDYFVVYHAWNTLIKYIGNISLSGKSCDNYTEKKFRLPQVDFFSGYGYFSQERYT